MRFAFPQWRGFESAPHGHLLDQIVDLSGPMGIAYERSVGFYKDVHTHTLNGVAVSTQRAGLLPISQHAISVLASLGYHDFEGPALRDDEKPRLVADLGDKTSLILRNHGLLTVGETVAEAFVAMYYLEASCAIQVRAQSGGGELIPVPKEIIETAYAQVMAAARPRGSRGTLVWPGLLRRLDRVDPSYRT